MTQLSTQTDAELADHQEISPEPRRPRRWGWYVAVALALLVLPLAGFLVGLAAGGSASEATVETEANVAAPPATLPAGEEPVAAVAASLAPSVVELQTGLGLGSGVIYDEAGLILTAAHVVENAETVAVVLSDGTRLEGTVVGVDPLSDVAVVSVDRTGLPAAPLALGQELHVGQMAIAIGSPFGLKGSVTSGIISAVAEPIPGQDGRVRTMIQTDAAINPGNSGGALANRQGEVIGVNDAIFSLSGGNDGIGFAIPIDTAVSVAERLVSGEEIRGAFLGVTGTDPELGRAGALVTGVVDGSAADEAGIQVGDLIVTLNDQPVDSFAALAGLVGGTSPGDHVTIQVVRAGEELTLTATLAERS